MSAQTRLVIVGANPTGQMPVALEIITQSPDYEAVALVDDDETLWGQQYYGLTVIGGQQSLREQLSGLGLAVAFIAVGQPQARLRLSTACLELGLTLPTFIHPAAYVSPWATVGAGCLIGAGAQVLPGAVLGDHVRIMAGAVISHHVQVGTACLVGPNATFTGRATVAECALVGAGCVVLNDVCIGAGATVGAGAVVNRDVAAGTTVVGIPARILPS